MLTRLDIHDMVSATVFARGFQIHEKGNMISDFVVDENWNYDGFDAVSAFVEGSQGNFYLVNFAYNPYDKVLEDLECNCPAFETYEGPCKHCVAVMLEYSDYLLKDSRFVEDGLPFDPRMLRKISNYREPKKTTTYAIKNLLNQNQHKMTLAFLQKDTYSSVRLEPGFHLDDDYGQMHFKVGFKIGKDRMYVLKNIYDFANRMEARENFSYGKKLTFVHAPENFEPEDRKMAEFICKVAENHPVLPSYMYYYGNRPSVKEPKLFENEIDEFFDLLGEKPILGMVETAGEQVWRIRNEKPKLQLKIEDVDDGIMVTADKLPYVKGAKNYMFFDYRHGDNIIYRFKRKEAEYLQDFFDSLATLRENRFFIEKEDIPVFCRELLPQLKKFYDCDMQDFYESDYGVVPVEFAFYLDAPQKQRITCKIVANYDEKKYNVFQPSMDSELRDLAEENHIITTSSVFFDALDEKEKLLCLEGGDDLIYDFLTRGVDYLAEMGEVYISDALKRLQVHDAPKVTVGVSLSGDLLNLTLTSGDMSRDDLVDILSKYDRKKKFYRLKNGDFVRVEDTDLETLAELKKGLNLTAKQLQADSIELPKYRALYLDNELHQSESLPVERSKFFKALIRDMKTVEDNDFEVPSSLETILREYQKKGFLWLKTLAQNGFGGILADDMGLGKTLQVIAFILSEFEEKENLNPVLIVCPASLVYNWASEIEKFTSGLQVRLIVGSAAERQSLISEITAGEVVVTSYELLKRDIDYYKDIRFSAQVIDEAQYIKNPKTQAAKSVKEIFAGFKLALTGTPIENRLSELWSIFDYLMPGFLYGYEKFRKELENPIVSEQSEEAMQRLQKMIRPFVLRRLKREVLRDLPEKIEENYMTRLEGEQQSLYDANVKELQLILGKQSDEEFNTSKIKILAAITRLRQLCCDPALVYEGYQGGSNKVDMCVDMITNAVDSGHKILLFSQFTSIFPILEKRFDEAGVSYYTLTGATSKENRSKMVKRFNEDNTSVFLISLKAGGTGLNLTAADIVIHFDPWWNVAAQNQATDRAHRIGQKKVVNVYKLIARGTIEENIIKLQEQKKELAEQLLSGEGIGSASFSREELLELLG